MKNTRSMKKSKFLTNTLVHAILTVMSIIWIFPVLWIIMTSFRVEQLPYMSYFFPKGFTLDNYIALFTDTRQFFFVRWFLNTLVVAIFSCLISTIYVLCISYSLSRTRFKARKPMMNVGLILNMFPGFMSMIAVYYILKGVGITQSLVALVLVYSGSAGLGYYIAKGFFDTIPKAIDEAAQIDGAGEFKTYFKIVLPLSKPVIATMLMMVMLVYWNDWFGPMLYIDSEKLYNLQYLIYQLESKIANLAKMAGNPELVKNLPSETARMAMAIVAIGPIVLAYPFFQRYFEKGITLGATKE